MALGELLMPRSLHVWQLQHWAPRSTCSLAWNDSQTLTWSEVADQTLVLHMALSDNMSPGHQLRPGCCRAVDLDVTLCGSPGPNDIMSPGNSMGYL